MLCFLTHAVQAHPLDFVQEKQALLLGNGTKIPIKGVFTNKGDCTPAVLAPLLTDTTVGSASQAVAI